MLDMLLVHQTGSSVTESQETVIILTHTIAVSGEGIDEQFKLIISSLADMDAYTAESILDMVGSFLDVFICWHGHHDIEMAIYQLLAFPGYHILNTLDVLDGYLVRWVRNGCMAVFLLVKH